MEMQHCELMVPLTPPIELDPGVLIPIFHRWIQEQWGEELLLDVADYRHLKDGPGVILVGYEATYSLVSHNGAAGFKYCRKVVNPGDNRQSLRQALTALYRACLRLQQEPESSEKFHPNWSQLVLVINDRIAAPNTAETFGEVAQEVQDFFKSELGADQLTFQHRDDPRQRFAVTISAPKLADLMKRYLPMIEQAR